MESAKSIEVGHTFYLGKKYSQALNATVRQQDNSNTVIEMGCYGIGVSRLVGAIAQVTRDSKGLRWPSSVSPYKISICSNEKSKDEVEKVKQVLATYEPYMDFDSKTNIGSRIQQSHVLGIPIAIIVGPKSWPRVEIEVRGQFHGKDWEQAYSDHHESLQWEFDATLNKHYVHHENVDRIIGLLLNDL